MLMFIRSTRAFRSTLTQYFNLVFSLYQWWLLIFQNHVTHKSPNHNFIAFNGAKQNGICGQNLIYIDNNLLIILMNKVKLSLFPCHYKSWLGIKIYFWWGNLYLVYSLASFRKCKKGSTLKITKRNLICFS